MKALTFNPANDRFEYAELAVPEIAEHEVLIKVEACGLNPVDAKIALWKGLLPPDAKTWVPGLDVAGTIVKTGAAVAGFKAGDAVLCHGNMLKPHGGFAEYSVQDAATLVRHPKLSAVAAAALPCAGWTAWRALVDKAGISPGSRVLIAGAAGGVGSYAVQIAKHLGAAKIIATCSAANADYVRSLGATDVIDYRTEDVASRVYQLTDQEGVSIGLDAVGGDNDISVANALGYEGQLVELVRTLRPEAYADAFMKGLSFHQLSLGAGHRYGVRARQDLVSAGEAFNALVEAGAIELPRIETVAFSDVAAQLEDLLQQRTVGKRVMQMA